MKSTSRYLILVVLFSMSLLVSCFPLSKESYLEDYGAFIAEISNNHSTFSDENWQEADERYKDFSVEWKKDFEDDLIWKDHIQLTTYEVKYNMYKLKGNSSVLMDGLSDLFSNYGKLKDQVKYYSDNEMDKDLEFLTKEAKKLGGIATETIEKILKELELEK